MNSLIGAEVHKHEYSLFISVDRVLPELGTPRAYYKCSCGSELSCDEGLHIINNQIISQES